MHAHSAVGDTYPNIRIWHLVGGDRFLLRLKLQLHMGSFSQGNSASSGLYITCFPPGFILKWHPYISAFPEYS